MKGNSVRRVNDACRHKWVTKEDVQVTGINPFNTKINFRKIGKRCSKCGITK